MSIDQMNFYQRKLAYEMDSVDLHEALGKTALKLLTLGFQVRELIGGLEWWKRDGYATHGAEARSETGTRCGC